MTSSEDPSIEQERGIALMRRRLSRIHREVLRQWRVSRNARGRFRRPILVLFFLVVGFLALWRIPIYQTKDITTDPARTFELENQARGTVATALGGAAVLFGVWAAYRQLRTVEDTLALSQSGQVSERFTRAIDQLTSPKLEARLGGIYSLERLALDHATHHWTVVEVLAAFVREHAKDPPAGPAEAIRPPALDIQAALTVLGRRKCRFEVDVIDLHELNLMGANLDGARLERANLSGSRLDGATLNGAILERAILTQASLDDTELRGANLRWAYCEATTFRGAEFQSTDLTMAHLPRATFDGSSFFSGVQLVGAHIDGTRFKRVQFGSTDFNGVLLLDAHLEGASLEFVENLSQEQIRYCYTDPATRMPAHITLDGRESRYSRPLDKT